MKLISEDGGDDMDFVRASKECSDIKVKQMQKRSLKFENMGNKDAKNDVCVEIITNELGSCKIAENTPNGITEMFTSLTLKEEKPDKTTSAAQEPQEVDELAAGETAEYAYHKADACEEKEEAKKSDMLVKLEAPSFDENEESEEKDPECSDGLGSRGPSYGIPVNHDPENSYPPYSHNGLQMPPNFPVYTNNQLQNNYGGGNTAAGPMKKRSLDKQDACNPSYKYTCPQMPSADMAYLQMPGDHPQETVMNTNTYNDLSGPKKVTSVYRTQMSGGTMVETDKQQLQHGQPQEPGADYFVDMNIPILPEYMKELLGPGVGLAGENFCPSGGQTMTPNGMGVFGFDDGASEGYNSDASPAGEIQMSPSPSPHSVMEAPNSSPPRQSWSPLSNSSFDSGVCSPLADDQGGNYQSQMRSPRQSHMMTHQTGAHSQMVSSHFNRSPPQHNRMSSPQHIKSPDHVAMSPEQPMMMPGCFNMMSATQQMSSSQHMSSPQHMMSSPQYMMSPYQGSQPYQNIQVNSTCGPCPVEDELIFHNYISEHLEDLNNALIVASEDLKEQQAKKGCRKGPTVENIPNIAELKLMSSNITDSNKTGSPKSSHAQPNKFEHVYMPKIPVQISSSSTVVNGTATAGNIGRQANVQVSYTEPRPPTVGTAKMPAVIPFSAQVTTNPPAGKVAIEKIRKASAQPVSSISGIPVIFVSPHPTKPRFTPIAPKEPTNPTAVTATMSSNIPQTVLCDSNRTPPLPPSRDVPKQVQPVPMEKTKKDKLLNIARRLVAEMSKPDLKFKDEDGDTYLHVAVCQADCFMVQALLERMVREELIEMIDMQNGMGQTPIYLAVSTNHPEMVQLLIDYNADANPFAEFHLATGAREKSAAIHCASQRGDKYLDTLKALLKAPDINLNQVNSDGHTALHCAILAHGRADTDGKHLNSIPIIQALISAGADPNLQTQQSGKTALMYALESRDLELIEKTLQKVEPSKLASYLKTQAFDGSTCYKIAELMKLNLHPTDQLRLSNCLKVNSNALNR